MRTISFWLFILVFAVSLAHAQDAATQQQIDKLSGQIQDLIDTQAQQGKRITALEKQISDLSDKVNTPAVNNSASADDLKALAAQVQEIDKKRQDDKELILKNLEQLAKVGADTHSHHSPTVDNNTTAAPTPQHGYPYTIESGNTLSAIAEAYRKKGVKVTAQDILKANPGLDPVKLYVGQKIFIPDPNAK